MSSSDQSLCFSKSSPTTWRTHNTSLSWKLVFPIQATKALRAGRGIALPILRPRHWRWGVGGQHHAPAALSPGKTRYPLHRRLGGPQGQSERVRKISPPTGIRSRDRPARSESLYRLSYPGRRFGIYSILLCAFVGQGRIKSCLVRSVCKVFPFFQVHINFTIWTLEVFFFISKALQHKTPHFFVWWFLCYALLSFW